MRGIGQVVGAVVGVWLAGCGADPAKPGGPGGGHGPGDGGGSGGGGFTFGTKGPWDVANVTYGDAQGIREHPVVGLTTDEAQNRWIATESALYLVKPGETAARRYDAADGLHLQSNPARYCDNRELQPGEACAGGSLSSGAAVDPGIRSVEGGRAGEVFVGYWGAHTDPLLCQAGQEWDDCDPLRHTGKIDWVRLQPDGTLKVIRFNLATTGMGGKYWHDRTVNRMAFDHFVNRGTLYAATEHGVDILFPDKWRAPLPGEWFDAQQKEYMGDHLHARVCFEVACAVREDSRMGDWMGLDVDAHGALWHAGKWTAGLITWDPDPANWHFRDGAAFAAAFGDPYYGPGGGGSTPIFEVAKEGHEVHLSAVSVCPDGRVWFASTGVQDGLARDLGHAIAVWDGRTLTPYPPSAAGLAEAGVQDLACLPDGRLALAGARTGVVIWDPAKGTSAPVNAANGLLPSDDVQSLEVDRMANPPTLHVATGAGAAALRVLP
ncbi:MAG: WD40 repeat domain-containing protein [Anaeromyxobacteraceae bacterium]